MSRQTTATTATPQRRSLSAVDKPVAHWPTRPRRASSLASATEQHSVRRSTVCASVCPSTTRVGFKETVAELADYEKAGLDIVWVAEAYSFDAVSQVGYLAAKTERLQIGSGILRSTRARRR